MLSSVFALRSLGVSSRLLLPCVATFALATSRIRPFAAPFLSLSRAFAQSADKFKTYIINEDIKADDVRIVASGPPRVVPLEQAIREARSEGLDVVAVSPKANPPVCKLFNYNAYVSAETRKLKEAKKAEVVPIELRKEKELRFKENIADHDLNIKLKKARTFLSKRHPVRVVVQGKSELLRMEVVDIVSGFCSDEGNTSNLLSVGETHTFQLDPLPLNQD